MSPTTPLPLRLLRTARRTGLAGLTLLLLCFCFAPAAFAQNGTLAGVVVYSETGETLIGVNVIVEELGTGAATGLDGDFRIPGVPAGSYTVAFSYLGYTSQKVTGVEVTAGETTNLDIALAEEAIELEGGGEVVVEATALLNNEAGLLRQRQRAAAVSDAVSAETISRSGSSSAADAMEKVTGASVQDGRYILVRGLGDRYMNTQLNGAALPSADPDRNAVPLDLFPSALLDNIVTSKTFTPDKPGDFTGGSVNIGTKAFPDALSFKFSASTSYDTEIAPGSDFLTVPNGGVGFFGAPSADVGVPAAAEGGDLPGIGEAFNNSQAATELDAATRGFGSVMAPVTGSVPVSQSYSISHGNRFSLAGRPFGYIAAVNWSRSVSGYNDGRSGRYELPGNVQEFDDLSTYYFLNDRVGQEEVLLGGLANLSYRPADRHELGLNLIVNRSGEQRARYRTGSYPESLNSGDIVESRALEYTERTLITGQLRGEHAFTQRGLKLEWNGSLGRSEQDEPDLRYFLSHYNASGTDTSFQISPAVYLRPTRYFRNLTEDTGSLTADLTLPLRGIGGRSWELKAGGSFQRKARDFNERFFTYQPAGGAYNYQGDPATFFSENAGIIDGTPEDPTFGLYISDATSERNQYTGEMNVGAGYLMGDLLLTDRFRFIGGARVEFTDMTTESAEESLPLGEINETDVLPSASLVYALTDEMNVRAAYGRTLARPTFREFSPYSVYDFAIDGIFAGNPDLDRTLIDNFDLRWEWFYRPGMIVAASGFYKQFADPIERTINPESANLEVQYRNVPEARVYGLEFEARTDLRVLGGPGQYFSLGGNLTLVQSEVDIDPRELEVIQVYDPSASDTRPMQGQSPYVFNLDLSFEQYDWGTTASLFYNLFGDRLFAVAQAGSPDFFEQPRGVLDLLVSQELGRGFSLSASAKNILGAEYRVVQEFKGQEFINQLNDRGQRFSIGVSYDL